MDQDQDKNEQKVTFLFKEIEWKYPKLLHVVHYLQCMATICWVSVGMRKTGLNYYMVIEFVGFVYIALFSLCKQLLCPHTQWFRFSVYLIN